MGIRGAGDAACLDAWIDGPREPRVLGDSNRLAGEIREPLALPRRLDPAVPHHEDGAARALLDHLLHVQASIEPVLQAPRDPGDERWCRGANPRRGACC
jgi:hypothetical protein